MRTAIAELSWIKGEDVPGPKPVAVSGLRAEPASASGRGLIDDPAALDLDPGHVRHVGVVDQAALAGIGQVVGGQRVAADVDVSAVAGLGRGQALAGVPRVKGPIG